MNLPKNEYRISIISTCNMKCDYCHNEGNKEKHKLSYDDIEALVRNSYNIGLKSIRLTGGEPLLHNEIVEICKMLKEKYNLKVGINTNAILITKLMQMIDLGYIDRVIVGLDFFDSEISKKSPIGHSSSIIKSNILKMKSKGVDVSVSKVFNNDIDEIKNLVMWGIDNNIRIKVIEEVNNEAAKETSKEFADMRHDVLTTFGLEHSINEFNEVEGISNGNKVVSFFHSHCRIGECDVCQKIQLRVTPDSKFKRCILYNEYDIEYNNNNLREKIEEAINEPIGKILIKRRNNERRY